MFDVVNPASLGRPRGFSHGVLALPSSRVLFVAGQIAADADGRIVDRAFPAQFEATLMHVLAVVHAAGGTADHLARMTIYVTDLDGYRASRPALGDIWQRHMGSHYPAMALVEVTRLVHPEAIVEIEATAVLPVSSADPT